MLAVQTTEIRHCRRRCGLDRGGLFEGTQGPLILLIGAKASAVCPSQQYREVVALKGL